MTLYCSIISSKGLTLSMLKVVPMIVLLILTLFFLLSAGISNCSCGDGHWSAWKNSGSCFPSWRWLQDYSNQSQGIIVRQENYTCGLCGKQIQTRSCLSAEIGCACKGLGVRVIPCNQTPCNIFFGFQCCPGFRIISGGLCGPLPVDAPNSSAPSVKCSSAGNIVTYCGCPKNGIWGAWRTIQPCPHNQAFLFKRKGSVINKNGNCGASQMQLQARKCSSEAKGCPCSGDVFRWVPCNLKICYFPLISCVPPFKATVINNANACWNSALSQNLLNNAAEISMNVLKKCPNSKTPKKTKTVTTTTPSTGLEINFSTLKKEEPVDCTCYDKFYVGLQVPDTAVVPGPDGSKNCKPLSTFFYCQASSDTYITLTLFGVDKKILVRKQYCGDASEEEREVDVVCDSSPAAGYEYAFVKYENTTAAYAMCNYEPNSAQCT